jgi:oxygen-dependent protoporphyrinogen oxidase
VKRVAIIGAGIAGLTAAYRLSCRHREEDGPLEIAIYESSPRVGGVIETVCEAGLVMERGPDSIVTEKPWALDLCREIGLGERVLATARDNARSLIVRKGRLVPVPDGLHLMAPSRLLPFALSPLLSIRGKLRMAADLVIPPRRDEIDESLAAFVRRRLGREALERLAQPMVGGVYTADPEKLSLAATMPRFLEMERRNGSVIRGMIAARKRRESGLGEAAGPRYELFVSLRDGMDELPRKLAELLPRGALRLGVAVRRVSPQTSGWVVETDGGSSPFDAVCIATPAYVAAEMVGGFATELARELAGIEYASSATVNLAYSRADVADPLAAFGFVAPAIERLPLIACTFTSRKYSHRAPSDLVLLRAFVGGALFPEQLERSDAEIVDASHDCLARLLGIRDAPRIALVTRYPRSMPQYHVGHLARIDRIERALARHPTLALAGSSLRGTGIPDCVLSGNGAANRLAAALAA